MWDDATDFNSRFRRWTNLRNRFENLWNPPHDLGAEKRCNRNVIMSYLCKIEMSSMLRISHGGPDGRGGHFDECQRGEAALRRAASAGAEAASTPGGRAPRLFGAAVAAVGEPSPGERRAGTGPSAAGAALEPTASDGTAAARGPALADHVSRLWADAAERDAPSASPPARESRNPAAVAVGGGLLAAAAPGASAPCVAGAQSLLG